MLRFDDSWLFGKLRQAVNETAVRMRALRRYVFFLILFLKDYLYGKTHVNFFLECSNVYSRRCRVAVVMLATLLAKEKLDLGYARNFDCDVSKPRRTSITRRFDDVN